MKVKITCSECGTINYLRRTLDGPQDIFCVCSGCETTLEATLTQAMIDEQRTKYAPIKQPKPDKVNIWQQIFGG